MPICIFCVYNCYLLSVYYMCYILVDKNQIVVVFILTAMAIVFDVQLTGATLKVVIVNNLKCLILDQSYISSILIVYCLFRLINYRTPLLRKYSCLHKSKIVT